MPISASVLSPLSCRRTAVPLPRDRSLANPFSALFCVRQLDFDGETRAVPADCLAEGGARDKTPGAEMAMARPDEPIVPCPRRFGATFAPNGSLVVFCSALAVVRARSDHGRKSGGNTRKQVLPRRDRLAFWLP